MYLEDINILIVDDVAAIRAQVRDLLKASGFRRFFVAKNAEEAKVALGGQSFHLIICDWHMEPTKGIDLLKHVRSDSTLKTIPFIMLTADSTMLTVTESIHSGVDHFLVKPITIAQVQTKVYKVLVDRKVLPAPKS